MKKYCDITGAAMITDQELKSLTKMLNEAISLAERNQSVIEKIFKHFDENHSMSFVQFEEICRSVYKEKRDLDISPELEN